MDRLGEADGRGGDNAYALRRFFFLVGSINTHCSFLPQMGLKVC